MSDVIALHFFWVEKIERFQMRKAVGAAPNDASVAST
jgi:hypothetical protein